MKEDGLISAPRFDEPGYYLQYGPKTRVTKEIQAISDEIKKCESMSDEMVIRNIIMFMNRNITRLHNPKDKRKFKRTAQEILESKERTGCCDSATLFRAIAIAYGIPTMQIIGFDRDNPQSRGHFYSGVYLTDEYGIKKWNIINSDQKASNIEDVRISSTNNIYDRNINEYYIFAYTTDYSMINVHGINIDSQQNMANISEEAYKRCDKKDMKEIGIR